MRKTTIATILVLAVIAAGLWIGCSTAPTGNILQNKPPETFLVNVPPGNDTINAITLVYWYGRDSDGVVAYYEWFLSGDSIDASQITQWDSVFASSDTMKFTIDDVPAQFITLDTVIDTILVGNDTFYKVHEVWHFIGYFYVRAVDDLGMRDPTPAVRGWNVNSVKPVIQIYAPDSTTGLVRYYSGTTPKFWKSHQVPVLFYTEGTTPFWKGPQVWWNRNDTLNDPVNTPIGYRYRIDNGTWSQWTDVDPTVGNDSFITIRGNISEGNHWFYLQGRNSSHIQSDIDSFYFRTINPDLDAGTIAVILANNYTGTQINWYQNLFQIIRPNATFKFMTKPAAVPFPIDSFKGVSLAIYLKEDFTKSNNTIADTLALYEYIQHGGKVWFCGPYMLNEMGKFNLGVQITNDYLGIDYFSSCEDSLFFSGAQVTQSGVALNYPNQNIMIDPAHTFPPNQVKGKFIESYYSSNPNLTSVYLWIGDMPFNETPVAVLHQDASLNLKTANFGFALKAMEWDSQSYEPIRSVIDATLVWFGL